MFTVSYFGNEMTGSGVTIAQVLSNHGITVDNQDPYVDGTMASMTTIPHAGARVTFRPRASGKATPSARQRHQSHAEAMRAR